MATLGTVQVPESTGGASQCCPCADQSGCNCPGGCSIICQSRSSADGQAVFVGYAEFINPSIPPLYYRTLTVSGGWSAIGGPNSGGCAIISCSADASYSGANTYGKVTRAFTNGAAVVVGGSCAVTGVSTGPVADITGAITVNDSGIGATDDFTKTSHTLIQSFACVQSGGGGFGAAQMQAQSSASNLTDVDEPADAIAFALIGIPWSGTDCSTNYSVTQAPEAGSRTFAFRAAQVQVSMSGTPGGTYQISVQLSQRAYGTSDPLVPIGLLVFELTLPPSGTGVSEYQQIPNVSGEEVHATGCTVQAI